MIARLGSLSQFAFGGDPAGNLITGSAAQSDWTADAPGVRRRITVNDLPPPNATKAVDNGPHLIARPPNAQLHVPPGFKVELYAEGFMNPRFLLAAPNGDVFVAESKSGEVRVLRDSRGRGKPDSNQVFASGLDLPFGLAFYPPGPEPRYLYVANTGSVVRFPYRNGDLAVRGKAESIAKVSSGGLLRGGGHWTRDVAFSRDGGNMFVSVGSKTNDNKENDPAESERARIFQFNPDGSGKRVYAWGIRNAVGIAIHPQTGDLWMSTNERDNLGDNLVPDYISRVQEGGFYGWPWYYIGPHQDPRHHGEHPELASHVIVPDVLVASHSATLNLVFYTGSQFPAEYRNDLFAAFHGSWNRSKRTGYKIVRVPLKKGKANGIYEDFVTGFLTPKGDVWGRPVGITVAGDGALLFSEDAGNTIWRVSFEGSASERSSKKSE